MHSAQKQEMPRETAADAPGASASGFGKVLTSIQGLQQRLDDFSLEEATRAAEKAREIIDDLGRLQKQLNAIGKLKEAVREANTTLAQQPEHNFDPTSVDGLENHPKLRAIIQAGKLIRMHRLLRVAQASAESISLDFETKHDLPPSQIGIGDSGVFSLDELSLGAAHPVTPVGITAAESTIQTVAGTVPSESPTSSNDAPPAINANQPEPTYEFADLKLELASEAAPQAVKPERAPAMPGKSSHFDQRLLDDLIETYGEFTTLNQTRETTASVDEAPGEPQEEPAASSMAPLSNELTPAEPAFVQSAAGAVMMLPPPEDKPSKPQVENEIAPGKSRGEIDRQLKNIIKDYGEYDLYSHGKSTINFKAAVIAAVTVLGLLFGGYYVLKAPPAPVPVIVDAK